MCHFHFMSVTHAKFSVGNVAYIRGKRGMVEMPSLNKYVLAIVERMYCQW